MKFKAITFLIIGILLLINLQNSYAQNSKAVNLLNSSLESMGGNDLLSSLKSLRYTAKGHEYMLEQSERPAGPFMVSYFTVQVEKNLTNPKCLYSFKYAANSRPYQILVDGDRVGAINGKNMFPMYPETDEQTDLAPEKIIFTAIQSNPQYIKDTVLQGINHHVIFFSWKQVPIRLFINQYTHLITGVEIMRYYTSNFNYVWGDTKRLTLYSFWHLEKNGLHYPFQSDVFVNGQHFSTATIDSIQFDQLISLDSLVITDSSFAKMQLMKKMIDPLEEPKLKSTEIASGIYFVPGNWNTSFIKTEMGIYIIEAPVSSVYSDAVIEEIKKIFPATKIAGIISTSDAWPHIGGLRTYAAQNIPIYILDLNHGVVKDLLLAKHTIFPDRLSLKKTIPALNLINKRAVLGTGDNQMEIYPMYTESGERMMVIYFPVKKLLYTSDLVQPSSKGGFFMKQYLSEINDVVNREGLSVENIFGMHLPLTSYSKLLKALD